MIYHCKECEYEFDVPVVEHPHNMYSTLRNGVYGCPVCQKAAAQPKKCPKCQSLNVIQKLGVI